MAWLTNITDIDPMPFGLLFERFLNPARISMPDFDIDFEDTQRERVIEYVKDKFHLQHLKYSKNRSKKDGENESKEFNKDWESILNNKSEKIEVQILDFKNFVSELFKEIYLRAQKDGKCFKIQINDNNYNEELLEKEFDKQLTFFKLAKNYLITYENKHKYIEIIKNELKYSFHKFKEYLKTI